MTNYEMVSADLDDLQNHLLLNVFGDNIRELIEGDPASKYERTLRIVELIGGDPFDTSKCERTLRHTRAWARRRGLSLELVEQFLGDHDAACDCEVFLNPDPHKCCLDVSSTCRHREVPASSPSTRDPQDGPIVV